MQAGPEVGNGFEERDVARVEGTSGPGTAQIIHIYLYAVRRLQDTRGVRNRRRFPVFKTVSIPQSDWPVLIAWE